MKQYIGISRDHSGSMRHLMNAAKNDYNDTIETSVLYWENATK